MDATLGLQVDRLKTLLRAGADPERAAAGIAAFTGLPHRMESVGTVAGVSYVNDSKATNPSAAARALDATGSPVIWIAGGRSKDLDFTALAGVAQENVRAAVLIGEAAGELEEALDESIDTRKADTLQDAVRQASRLARPGDVVLLAPACASHSVWRPVPHPISKTRSPSTLPQACCTKGPSSA